MKSLFVLVLIGCALYTPLSAQALKMPTFKNPASCPKVSNNGRCGPQGAGGKVCASGTCSNFMWCGPKGAWLGAHKEWYSKPGCYNTNHWKA